MIDLLFALAELFIISSFIFRDIFYLRLLANLGLSCYLIGALIAGYDATGMKALILFNVIGLVINTYQILFLLHEKRSIDLGPELNVVYYRNFSMVTIQEFLKLLQISTIKKVKKGTCFVTQNAPVSELCLIKSGTVDIIINNSIVTQIGRGFYIGEMSFLSGNPASATVQVASNEIEMICWKISTLEKLHHSNLDLYNKFNLSIANNLIQKVNNPSTLGIPNTNAESLITDI